MSYAEVEMVELAQLARGCTMLVLSEAARTAERAERDPVHDADIAVVAPMPSARVSVATIVKPGARSNVRPP
jgi:hypothetical protein